MGGKGEEEKSFPESNYDSVGRARDLPQEASAPFVHYQRAPSFPTCQPNNSHQVLDSPLDSQDMSNSLHVVFMPQPNPPSLPQPPSRPDTISRQEVVVRRKQAVYATTRCILGSGTEGTVNDEAPVSWSVPGRIHTASKKPLQHHDFLTGQVQEGTNKQTEPKTEASLKFDNPFLDTFKIRGPAVTI
ncbi:hypothetical protein MMC25_005454 [Agyrium rufum]|nr:hypothetical protein [Agyrium rufum]